MSWGSACLRGKWERKENGEGKGGKGEHFPRLVRRENGRGKKMGKENSVGPCPIFPPTFSSQNGGILGQIFSPILYPYLILIALFTQLHSSQNKAPLLSCFLTKTWASLISLFLLHWVSCFVSFLPCLWVDWLLNVMASYLRIWSSWLWVCVWGSVMHREGRVGLFSIVFTSQPRIFTKNFYKAFSNWELLVKISGGFSKKKNQLGTLRIL